MKILIIGGNHFFGRRLAKNLSEKHDVTLLNRGNVVDGLGAAVNRLRADRSDEEQLRRVLQDRTFDVIYDQVCYNSFEADLALRVFRNRTRKYIFTSTVSVYDMGADRREEFFNPLNHKKVINKVPANYQIGKRDAEAVFLQQEEIPVTAVRFPIVLGPDDYTNRLNWHIDRIRNDQPMFLPNLDAHISFIHSEDAAKVLEFLSSCEFSGPVNAGSLEPIRLRHLIRLIEDKVGHKANLITKSSEGCESPFGAKNDWTINSSRLRELGFVCAPIDLWIGSLIDFRLANSG